MEENRSKDFKPFPFRDKTGTQVTVDDIVDTFWTDKDSIWIWSDERAALYELARGYHNKPETQGYILDLGTHRGGSASIMATAVRDSGTAFKPVITIDRFWYNFYDPDDDHTRFQTQNYLESRRTFTQLNLGDEYICQVICPDDKFLDFWNLPTRLIFIDTEHTYEHVKLIIEKSIPHVMEDGWLVFHDYIDRKPHFLEDIGKGVRRAVNEFLDNQTEYDLDIYFADSSLICLHIKEKPKI